jgi:6-phospho-beta-glucosidase
VREWTLMDINPQRLEIVGNFTRTMVENAGLPTKVTLTTDLREAVTDADFVITTMRVGGAEGRILDETIPPKHGMLIGQETTAPGGLAMGLRGIPVILEVARAIEEHASPHAWLINLANPSGMLAEALNQHSNIQFAGLCNGPTVARGAVRQAFGVQGNELFCKLLGLNHLIWLKVYLDGEDVTMLAIEKLTQWFDREMPGFSSHLFVGQDIQRFAGWIPMGPYMRYYYELPESIADQGSRASLSPQMLQAMKQRMGPMLEGISLEEMPTRAHMVKLLEQKTMALYAEGDIQGYELARHTRGGRGYGEAGLSLASSIWNSKNEIHGPDVPHRGSIPGLPRDVVATTTAIANRSGIYPLAMDEMPKHMMSFILAAKNYELLAVEAAVTGSYHAALEALMANPLVLSYHQAKAALDELLVAHKVHLPNFGEAIGRLEKGEDPLH